MRTVYWMAQEDIPISKYPSLVNLQKLQGCSGLDKISVAKNATYNCRNSGEEFQESIASIIHTDIVKKLKDSEMFSILVDETTDISISKQMIIYARVVDKEFTVHSYFLANITITNVKSDAQVLFGIIEEYLVSQGLDLRKVYGFGSDGAAVMVGRHNGVATRVKNKSPHCVAIHCMAHRLNLSTSQASKNVPYLKEFEETMSDLFYFFGGAKSGNRQCELAEIQKVLDDPQVKVKECHEIRWISFYLAVHAVYKTWASLVMYFTKHTDKKSEAMLKKLTKYRFVFTMHMMMDILPSVSQMSMILQKRDIDIAAINPALSGLKDKIKAAKKGTTHYQTELSEKLVKTKDDAGAVTSVKFKGQSISMSKDAKVDDIRKEFCHNMVKNIEDRFPKEAVDVAMSFQILGMRPLTHLSKEQRDEYGNKELNILIQHYGEEKKKDDVVSKSLIDAEQVRQEWSLCKEIVMQEMYPRTSIKDLWKMIFTYHRDTFPNMLVLARLALIMPYQTADCERGFSCQNGIKTSRRNRLQEKHLNDLMTIKIEGPRLEDMVFQRAIISWKHKKERKIFKY